jgi:GNAT superfamily N-acetyltransferase
MLTISQISSPQDIAAVRDLVIEFTTWAISLDPDEAPPTFDNLDRELASLPGDYGPPTGCFLLARDEGRPVGCVAFKSHGHGTVELKRMYVRPDQRGKGTGQQLVSALIKVARTQNNRRIILDSFHTMTSAHNIYRGLGFADVPAPAGFPPSLLEKVVFMELALD